MCILNRLKIIALLVILIGIVVEYPKPMVIIGGLRFKCDVCDVRDVCAQGYPCRIIWSRGLCMAQFLVRARSAVPRTDS